MYRIKSTGEIKSQGELRKMFYNTSFPRVWDESVLTILGLTQSLNPPHRQPLGIRPHIRTVSSSRITSGCGHGQLALSLQNTR
jgi:hypothetical protein